MYNKNKIKKSKTDHVERKEKRMEYIAFFIVTAALGYIAVRCAIHD